MNKGYKSTSLQFKTVNNTSSESTKHFLVNAQNSPSRFSPSANKFKGGNSKLFQFNET